MARLKITKRSVDDAPIPAAGDAYFWDTELRGFGLRVTPKGVRSYVVQYRLPSRPARRMTIGVHGSPWTPEKARKRAEQILFDVKRGDDPVQAAKKRAREAVDLEFSRYVEAFTDGYLKHEWKDSWADAKRRLEQHVVPHLKGRPLPEIEKHEVSKVILRLKDRPALARNTHAVLRKLFAWAVDQGDLGASPIPAAPSVVQARKRVLTPEEVVAAWQASFKLDRPMGQFIRLLFATLQRRSEVAAAPWTEFGELPKLWRLEGERAKNDNDHLVPLSPLAVEVLAEMAAGPSPVVGKAKPWPRKGFVFTTTGTTPISGFSKVKAKLDREMLPILQALSDKRADALGHERELVFMPPWRLHDIRRTGTTQMQALGVPIEVTERVINHTSGETAGIRGVYNLHAYNDEKRKALDAWGGYLQRLVAEAEQGSKVVALPTRAA
ncbi:site-specific integrase [Sphingomonas sp. TZW2008]|uniref:tyrosine-type recombinase/integrase n=1 Tax=Sphingomonas sp. TZW2008 TaxID=1917973 RepID=UPI000A26CDAD|nr:site-specific integrase [Sphingomonas sp. TZW2008]